MSAGLTDAERQVVRRLAEAWSLFLALPVQHPNDREEMCAAIHRAQDRVLVRVARRTDCDLLTNTAKAGHDPQQQ